MAMSCGLSAPCSACMSSLRCCDKSDIKDSASCSSSWVNLLVGLFILLLGPLRDGKKEFHRNERVRKRFASEDGDRQPVQADTDRQPVQAGRH